ncbi:MAG: ABC transporter permease [Firmicutes bacterium]|nr:ABC transporter permease [Bacillota bacterium]
MIFWTLIFPIILSTFFYLAFSNLVAEEKLEPFPVAYLNNETMQEEQSFITLLTELSKGKEKLFHLKKVNSEKKAKELLDNHEIEGYFVKQENLELVIKENGMEQSILKTVVDEYLQMNQFAMTATDKSQAEIMAAIQKIQSSRDAYFVSDNKHEMDVSVIYFYTLIGMVCMYAGFFGLSAVNAVEGNLSKHGARFSVAPVSKIKSLSAFLLAGFLIHYLEFLTLFSYLKWVLKIDFRTQSLAILLLALIGSLAGLAFGMVIGASSRKSEDAKINMVTMMSLLLSFLSGMMVIDIKQWILTNMPFLAHINPVSLVTDGLYALYYYPTYTRYFENLIYLGIFSIVMFTISCYLLRRKKYDSI